MVHFSMIGCLSQSLQYGYFKSYYFPEVSRAICFDSTFQKSQKYTMKLLTHNFLTSKALKGVKVGHPLILNVSKNDGYNRKFSSKTQRSLLQIVQKEEKSVTFNAEFLTRILPRLHWETVCTVAQQVGVDGLPSELSETDMANETVLQKLHHVLLEVDVIEGNLKCPETGRLFPITDGIPNMLLNEFET